MSGGAAKPKANPRGRGVFCFLLLAFCPVSVLSGCAGDQRMAGDPLIGGANPTPPAAAGRGPAQAPIQTASVPPPPPAPAATASPAALASASSQPLDPTHDIHISDPRQPNDNPAGVNLSLGTPVSRPLPPPDFQPQQPPAGPAPTFVPAPGAKAGSYEQAQALLAARGVSWQRLEMGDQAKWKFTCSIPNPQNHLVSRTYEAQAADYLSAVQAVLDQINKEK